MAAAASVEPTEYECPVCSEYFKHPKLLLCGHVLCRECLVSCLQSNAKATCPLCRCQMVDDENHDSKSAEEIADSLIDDVAMARVVESARILSGKNVCCVHSSVTASSLCLHCNDMLCKDCCHAHGIISATRHHVVESLTSLTAEKLAASRYVMCSAHNDRIAELFCSTHLVSLCHVCAVSDHSQCPEVANVKKETQAARSQLDQLLVTLGNADLSFKQKSDTLSQLELQMKNSTQSVVQTLEEAIKYLQRSLEECHQRLREVHAADVVNLNAVKKLRDKLVKRHGKVVSHMIVVKRVQQTVSGSELLDVAAKLQTCVDRLHLDVSVPTNLNRVSMALHDFNPVVLTRLLQDGYWNHFRLVGAQSFIQGMEMSDGKDTNTNTSTNDKYSTQGATKISETETRVSLCENSHDFGSHNNSISTASEANVETLKVAPTVLFRKSEEISALRDITDAGVDMDILESAVKEITIGGVKEDKLEGFEESIKEIKTSECGGGDASVNCLGYTESKDPAVCTTEVTDSTKNISEKIYYSLAEVNTDGKEGNAELVETDGHRGKRNKESGICMQTVEDIVVDPPENTEQVSTAINSAHDSALQCIETDKEENTEVDLSENTEQQVNTAVDSACESVLQFTETDKEENIEVDLPRNTELIITVIDSACRILECTEAGAHIGNTNEGIGIDREESTTKEQIIQDINTDEGVTDKPKESINKDTTEVTKFLIEGNNLVTILTNSAVTENEGTITKRPETKVTETQTNCPQTDKSESEVEIISPNTFNSNIKKSGAGEGKIIKCFLEERTNFSSPDHIPEIFITSAEPILADLPSTLETQKTKVETDSQEDDSMDVHLTQNETTLTKDVEKPLETTKHIGFLDIGYNQDNPDNLSSYNDAQEPMEITEHSINILNYDDTDFDTDSDFEAEAHVSGGESKKLEAAEKEPEPEAAEEEPELEVEETQEKKMGCIKSKAKRNQYTINQHGQSSDEENDENGWQIQQSKKSKTSTFRYDSWSTRDTNAYRERYPGKEDNPDLNANLKFYKGKITSCPKGDYIDEIHRKWWGNYDKLEQHQGYIQWLFPNREQGMNWHAQELQPHEAKAIMADSEAMERFLKSYKMMLHFYGMELVSEKTGEVKRAKNCQERFRHLNHSMHNYLRITRILKCLGELGHEHYKAPFICFVLKEAIVHKTLDRTLDSCFKYWIGTLRNDEERADIDKYIDELYNDCFQE